MDLENLIGKIQRVDADFSQQANKAINQLLTLRNWLIGFYIVEFEQNGEERSVYGDKLLFKLAEELKDRKGLSLTNLGLFRQFYIEFPEVGNLLSKLTNHQILQSLTGDLSITNFSIPQSLTEELKNSFQVTDNHVDKFKNEIAVKMLNDLSFTHITLLLPLDSSAKRAFYIIEAIKGVWTVRELRRQINSLLYERSGMSVKPELLLKNVQPIEVQPQGLVKDIYTFEFLGLPEKDAIEESDLETALLDHLREFILELGNGFCLEARQKRILIGNEYFFIDLVFYHRILKCHFLIELKVNDFDHGNAAQLNTYLNYYKEEVKEDNDNDPVGLLLVTGKNEPLVKYATAGMDKNLFVSKYLLQLPSIEKLKAFLKQEIKNI